MQFTKQLVLALTFLILLLFTLAYSFNFLQTPYGLLSLDLSSVIPVTLIPLLLLLTSFVFILFCTLTQDWKLILPVVFLSALLIYLLPVFTSANLTTPDQTLLAMGILVTLPLVFLSLKDKLNHYLTFQPTVLLIPSVKGMSTVLFILLSLIFLLLTKDTLSSQGLQLPDSLIDSITQASSSITDDNTGQTLNPNSSLFNQLSNSSQVSSALNQGQQDLKQSLKLKFTRAVKPYTGLMAPLLALLLFLTLNSFASIIALLLYPFTWFIFYVLEKLRLIEFSVEMREVKKLTLTNQVASSHPSSAPTSPQT